MARQKSSHKRMHIEAKAHMRMADTDAIPMQRISLGALLVHAGPCTAQNNKVKSRYTISIPKTMHTLAHVDADWLE